jgi:hypothetical protein
MMTGGTQIVGIVGDGLGFRDGLPQSMTLLTNKKLHFSIASSNLRASRPPQALDVEKVSSLVPFLLASQVAAAQLALDKNQSLAERVFKASKIYSLLESNCSFLQAAPLQDMDGPYKDYLLR